MQQPAAVQEKVLHIHALGTRFIAATAHSARVDHPAVIHGAEYVRMKGGVDLCRQLCGVSLIILHQIAVFKAYVAVAAQAAGCLGHGLVFGIRPSGPGDDG
jgi:hypothetical protein